jgi:uncharacterized protein YyaL (SSP411 family)
MKSNKFGDLLNSLLTKWSTRIQNDAEHAKLCAQWLLSAQKNSNTGYSHSYSFLNGWLPAYPETTGYIIPTMISLGKYFKESEYIHSAVKAGEWLLTIQHESGGFCDIDGVLQIFDTGQIIEGLIELFKYTNDKIYINAATKAGGFLCEHQNEDGCWTRNAYNGISHSYYSKVGANLLKLAVLISDEKFFDAGNKNIQWTINQQTQNAYFRYMAFKRTELPYLHNIIYVLEGLLESYLINRNEKVLNCLQKTVDCLLEVSLRDAYLYSQYDSRWKPFKREYCLTGLAQWARLLFQLTFLSENDLFKNEATKTLLFLKKLHIQNGSPRISGGLPGSYPIWGRYSRLSIPNWAVKFFADALLLSCQKVGPITSAPALK